MQVKSGNGARFLNTQNNTKNVVKQLDVCGIHTSLGFCLNDAYIFVSIKMAHRDPTHIRVAKSIVICLLCYKFNRQHIRIRSNLSENSFNFVSWAKIARLVKTFIDPFNRLILKPCKGCELLRSVCWHRISCVKYVKQG